MIADNPSLVDVWNTLDIQVTQSSGTLVVNNSQLCVSPSLLWGQRKDSLIEYNISQVCDHDCADVDF